MQITSAVEVSTVWLDPSNANHILLEVLVNVIVLTIYLIKNELTACRISIQLDD